MKLVANLFIAMALVLLIIGVISKFYSISIIFANTAPLSHLVFANTCLLLALILKLAAAD